MKNTNVEVEKESNAVLSKWSEELSEEQFNNFRFCFRSLEKDWFFDGFYPTINTELLMLIKEDFIPVISPMGLDQKNQTYNINADTAAGALATNLKSLLLFCKKPIVVPPSLK